MAQLAELLEQARTEKGLSRNKAAEALGTSATTYRQWVRGQRPELERFPLLAEFVGVSVNEIVEAVLEGPPIHVMSSWDRSHRPSDIYAEPLAA